MFDMTLCIIWRNNNTVHMAADSRLSFGSARADIAIKISREYYSIRGADQGANRGAVIADGDVAFCFAGSGSGSVFMKESLSGILGELQAVPGWHGVSFADTAGLIFEAYKIITLRLTAAIFDAGFVDLVVAGLCPVQGDYRTFICKTKVIKSGEGATQEHTLTEVLSDQPSHMFIGNGAPSARTKVAALGRSPTSRDLLRILKEVIDDPTVPGVGGAIQYGFFDKTTFATRGILEVTPGDDVDPSQIHYWRGALDLRDQAFEDKFGISYPMIALDEFFP